MANAVMHTTGQPYMMAFQAGGPHAQDRGLEALSYAYKQLSDIPTSAVFEKPDEPLFEAQKRKIDLLAKKLSGIK